MSLKSFNIDQFVAEYAPSESTFDLTLPGGEVLKFRIIQSYADLQQFKQDASVWYQSLPKTVEPGHPMYGLIPKSPAEAMAAFTISELSVEPKLEHLDAFKILKAPWLVETLLSTIDLHNKSIAKLWESKAVESAKKNSALTSGPDSDSPSPETVSESIQTS